MSSDASSTNPSSTTSPTNPPDGTTSTTVSGGQLSAKLPNDIVSLNYHEGRGLALDLILDLAKSNWTEPPTYILVQIFQSSAKDPSAFSS
ncbi:hypothetical protein BGY98DRAFT_1104201 [Russula aff. rugulosa BPL654]|nr:hypothetical protein BGY98DRAFT_1104201 [Russula aff. rugulosa BPL654]